MGAVPTNELAKHFRCGEDFSVALRDAGCVFLSFHIIPILVDEL